MRYGPVEMLMLQTPEPPLSDGVVAALRDLVARDDIRIIDLAFVSVGPRGQVSVTELEDLPAEPRAAIRDLVGSVSGLISDDDLATLGTTLDPGTSAGVLLLEHHWAPRLDRAVRRAGGTVRLHLRIPRDTVVEVAAARDALPG
jgi:Family of unknown function (DUF6325)